MLPDTINFIRKLTLHKLWNILVVQLSYSFSAILKRPIVWGSPWFVSIEPASVCNLTCPQCPVGAGDIARENKFMTEDAYRELLDQISPSTSMLSLYFQGEPLMNKRFARFVRLASDRNIYTQTSTNGQLLTEDVCRELVDAGLDRIIISLDGTDQESYQTYRRGGEFQKVEHGVRTLDRFRREKGSNKPYLIIQFLVFRHNQLQIPEAKRLARDWGADKLWIKSAQIEYPESADELIPVANGNKESLSPKGSGPVFPHKFSRYEKSPSGEWKLRAKLRNRCKRLWQTTVITSDKIIVPCCFDKRAEFPMGRLGGKEMSGEQNPAVASGFGSIWKSKEYQDFRKKVLTERKGIEICTNCTEGIAKLS